MSQSTDHRAQFIVNMQANHGRNIQRMHELRGKVERMGEVDWIETAHVRHATELAKAAAEQGYARIVAVGGDGTINEVVNGLMQLPRNARPVLDVVPVGSGNDFTRGISTATHRTNVLDDLLSTARARPVDIAYASINGNQRRYWCNALGIGFDAAVNMHSRKLTRLSGSLMYFVAVLRTLVENFDSPQMEITIDNERSTRRVMMLTIGNGTREGGGFITTPAALPDDGVLDYAMIGPVSRPMILRLIPEVMRGTHGRFSQVKMGTLKSLTLKSERPILIHADGEMLSTYEDNIRVVEVGLETHALQMVI